MKHGSKKNFDQTARNFDMGINAIRLKTIVEYMSEFYRLYADATPGYSAAHSDIDPVYYMMAASISKADVPDYIRNYVLEYLERRGTMMADAGWGDLLFTPQIMTACDTLTLYKIICKNKGRTAEEYMSLLYGYISEELTMAGKDHVSESEVREILETNPYILDNPVASRYAILTTSFSMLTKMRLIENRNGGFYPTNYPRELFEAYVNLEGTFEADKIL